VNRNKDYVTGWKIVPTFNISQRDHTVLHLFQEILCCGRIRDRGDGVGYFDVRRMEDLVGIILPFFERFSLRSVAKRKQFEVFRDIVHLLQCKEHHHRDGLRRILLLRDSVHVARKRKYSSETILLSFRSSESSETIRRTPVLPSEMI
jgi:hypothetical protein